MIPHYDRSQGSSGYARHEGRKQKSCRSTTTLDASRAEQTELFNTRILYRFAYRRFCQKHNPYYLRENVHSKGTFDETGRLRLSYSDAGERPDECCCVRPTVLILTV